MIKPILVSTDPCKQNIMKGADVDVLKFPIPLIHGGDSGTSERGTRSPRIRIVHLYNRGMYRLMVHDRNTVVCLFPLQHILAKSIKKYEAMNRPCLSRPTATALSRAEIYSVLRKLALPERGFSVVVGGGTHGDSCH
jgi:3-polyprenyl-4-hydroxybenzoate decarboxylase